MSREKIRALLVEAIMEADGGPTGENARWEAEDIADDILATDAWGRLINGIDAHYRAGFARARALTVHDEIAIR